MHFFYPFFWIFIIREWRDRAIHDVYAAEIPMTLNKTGHLGVIQFGLHMSRTFV